MTSLRLLVRSSALVAEGIREIAFASPDGGPLPSHPPGSHVVVECGSRRNAYSLTNAGDDPREYTVAVLRKPDGNGGSELMHRFRPGDEVVVSRPRSAFPPVRSARKHLLIAGGIGITPLLSHAREAIRWDDDAELLYAHRPEAAAFADLLDALLGERVHRTSSREEFGRLLRTALHEQPLGTHLYVCGPQPMQDHVLDTAVSAGWPQQRLHRERFTPVELDPGERFTARLARSGRAITVDPGTSLLETLLENGISVPNMCRQGVCGECRVRVTAGTPLHRDEFLDEDERAAGCTVMCCVSRSQTDTLEVDL